MKKNLTLLTLSVIFAILMCFSAFALTLDSAEEDLSMTVSSAGEAALAAADEFDLIFYEDFQNFTAPTNIVTGGFGPVRTQAKISYVGGNWGGFADKFYLDTIDSFPGLRIITDIMSGAKNNALFMDRFSGSGAYPGLCVWGDDSDSSRALGINSLGEYVFTFDIYVPSTIAQATYAPNGSANGIKAGDAFTARVEFVNGVVKTSSIIFTADMIDKWNTVTLTFTMPENTSINMLRIFNNDADAFVAYFDNLKLYRKAGEATVYLDAEKTVKALGFPLTFSYGDIFTLPSATDVAEYIPEGYKFAGFAKGGELYEAGVDYTATVMDTTAPMDFTPVFIPQNAELVFFEDFSGFASGTELQKEGTNRGLKSNGVQPAYSKYEGGFQINGGHGGHRSLYVYNVGTTPNKALLIDHKSAYGFNGGGFTTTFAEPGKYVLSAKTFVPSVVENSKYATNGSVNSAFNGQTITARYDCTNGKWGIGAAIIQYNTWQTLSKEFTLDVGDTVSMFTFYNGASAPGVSYFDDYMIYRVKEYANIYLDANMTVLYDEPVEFVPGSKITLPTIEMLEAYIPEGKELKGFVIGGTIYAPGAEYTFTADNANGMKIAPSYVEPIVPSYGDLIFYDDFSSYEANQPATFGLSAPSNTYIPMNASCVGENWTDYNSVFNYLSGAGIRDIRVRNMTADIGNKALQLEGWYQTEYIGAYIGNYTLSGNTATDSVTGKQYATISSTKGMNIVKSGNYRVNFKAYVPTMLTQFTETWKNGNVNRVTKVSARAYFANGKETTSELVIDNSNRDSWQNITLDFTIEEGTALNYILLFADVETNNETTAIRYGEVFFDEVKLYEVDATVTYTDEEGEIISENAYFPGADLVLPGADIIGYEPVFVIDGREYFAGDVYTTNENYGCISITVKQLEAPQTLNVAQIRTEGIQGLRYAAFVTEAKRELASEYGFIAALAESCGGDYNSLTFDGTVRYVSGAAYTNSGKDIVYSYTGEEFGNNGVGEGYYFTACLTGIPASEYETDIVGRPYIVIDGMTFYGKPIIRNIKEVADATGIELQ